MNEELCSDGSKPGNSLLECENAALREKVGEFTFEDAKNIVRGAADVYGGGYSGEERKAFTAGILTAFSALENAKRNDTQTFANLNIGKQSRVPQPPAQKEGLDE